MTFSWASWTSRMAKSIVVRFVVRNDNLMKNMEERLMASGHPVSWWTVHRYLTNVAEVKATQNHVFSPKTEAQRRQMLKFAALRHNWTVQNWRRFLFINKSPFTPFHPHIRQNNRYRAHSWLRGASQKRFKQPLTILMCVDDLLSGSHTSWH